MNPPLIDLTGQRFGRLVVLQLLDEKRNGGRMWLCSCDCGTTKAIRNQQLKSGRSKSCGCLNKEITSARSKLQTGALNPSWKGGKKGNKGYVTILCREHPRARQDGYVSEHILVMEKKLGRPILPTETIHHKNGVKNDNRPENLELWITRHSNGQRIEDLVIWALEFLNRYAPEHLREVNNGPSS